MTWYAKSFAGAAELRGQLAVIETVEQGLEIIDRAIARLNTGIQENEEISPQLVQA
jgi:tRNA-dihydrouridine synthase B